MFKKLYCMHNWMVHAKKEFDRHLTFYNGGTKTETIVIEVLICEKCGKIKQIEY